MLIVPASIGLFGDGFPGAGSSSYSIRSALKFDGVADYLKLTPSSGGSTSKATYSFWAKRSGVGDAELDVLNCETDSSTQRDGISFGDGSTADMLSVRFNDANDGHIKTNDLMRDPTAWQHWVVAIDTSQGTAANRVKIYKNGTQITSFATASYPAEGYVMQGFMQDDKSFIGTTVNENNYYFDGYLADFIGIDGIQLAASAFGENDSNGVWGPKDPSNSANIADWGGKNSFWLKFDDGSNIGKNSRPTTVTTVDGTYKIDKSVWFNGTSDRLTFDPSGASSTPDLYCISYWAKRAKVGGSDTNVISGGVNGFDSTIRYTNYSSYTDAIQFYANGGPDNLITNAAFSDPTAWHHVFARYDSNASGGSGDYMQLWVNGVRLTSFASSSMPSAGENSTLFDGNIIAVGGYNLSATQWFDGYLADVAASDGQDHAATDFGGYDASGNWVPIDPSGLTYGTNGFLLQFKQTGSSQNASGIGADTSGNDNHFAVEAGSPQTHQVTDSPTNTSGDDEGNYATLNPIATDAGDYWNSGEDEGTLTLGNLTWALTPNSATANSIATQYVSSGKWYWEVTVTTVGGTRGAGIGVSVAPHVYSEGGAASGLTRLVQTYNGNKRNDNNGASTGSSYASAIAAGSVVGVALDMDNGAIWISDDDVWVDGDGSASSSTVKAEIEAGTTSSAMFSDLSGKLVAPLVNIIQNNAHAGSFNFGQTAFSGTVPTGFKKLHTANLAEPTVTDPRAHFANALYTGTAQSKTVRSCFDSTGTAWTPDFVWIKSRSETSDHVLVDSVRGPTNVLTPDDTPAEFSDAKSVTSLIEGGFTLGPGDGRNDSNDNAETYVAWCMKAGGAASTTSPAGTVASSTSVADHGGFSIGTFTAPSSGAFTIGHGLSRVPAMIIVKSMDATGGWWVWVEEYAATGTYLRLETTDGTSTSGTFLSATPTSEVFATNTSWLTANHGHVFYAFAKTPGMIASGTYTGNAVSSGAYVNVDDGASGFRPAWVMVKRLEDGYAWHIHNSAMSPHNPVAEGINANDTGGEASTTFCDFTANGFKLRTTNGGYNGSATYIYLAFADQPFNLARAR